MASSTEKAHETLSSIPTGLCEWPEVVVRDSIVSPELGTQANPIVIGDDLAPLGSASNPIVIYVGECSCRNGTDQVGFDADTEIMTTLEFWETLIDGDFTVPADEGEAVVHPPIRSLVREDPEDLQSSEQSSPDFSLLDDKALKATESSFYRLQNCSGLEAPSSGNTRNGHKKANQAWRKERFSRPRKLAVRPKSLR